MILGHTLRAVATIVTVVSSTVVPASAGTAAPAGGPPTVTGADLRFTHPSQTLRYGTAGQAGLVPQYVDRIADDITGYLRPSPTYPEYAGAVALAAHDGVIVAHDAAGYALRYADDTPTELPPDQWIPMRPDTIFDLASMTKLFTAIAAVQLIQAGRVDLNAPVARYIPAFAANGKANITIRNLLTHTSGLPADPDPSLCDYPTNDQRWAAVYAVAPFAPPDTAYLYSDMNMMTMGKVIEAVTGQTLDQVIAQRITRPLAMTDTMFNPPASLRPRIAAEEFQPWTGRGIVWGSVHDENAYCVGGVSGHAGLFSTAHDLGVLAQALLDGGRYGRARILSEESVRSMFTDYNQAFPGNAHGLGFELDQRWYMDGLTSPVTAGHTGYTGTSIVIDPLSDSFVILLTNRVHPSRNWGSNNPSRRAVARDLALAMPVRPAAGPTDWFSGTSDATTATLSVPVAVPAGGARLSFDLWYDTEETDIGALEASSDGGATWRPVPFALRVGGDGWQTDGSFSGFEGRQWLHASAQLPGLTTDLRWRYTTDSLYQGRGVYLDAVRVTGPHGVLLDDGRPADAARFQPHGWVIGRN
jgi:CubicO group peptidase (beta-lactamase class C family)